MPLLDDIQGGFSRASIGETGLDPIVLDASVSETHSKAGELSDHPVETGVDISDHYRALPDGLQITGVVSNSPIAAGIPGESLLNSVVGLVNGDEDPSANAWQEFNRFFDDAVMLTITTSLKEYQNMVLTSLDVTRDVSTTNGLFFAMSAREVRFASTEEGEALTLPTITNGQKAKSAGKAPNSDANSADAVQSSAAVKIFQGLQVIN